MLIWTLRVTHGHLTNSKKIEKIIEWCQDVVQLFSHAIDMDAEGDAMSVFSGFCFIFSKADLTRDRVSTASGTTALHEPVLVELMTRSRWVLCLKWVY